MNIRLSTGVIEQVNEFKYLGVNIQDGTTGKTVRERIALGQRTFGRLSKIWRSNKMSIKLKIKLLSSVVIPTALYGAECWVLKKEEERKLLAFEMKCLRRICGIRWEDRVRNEEVKTRTGQNITILDRVQDMQRRWFGHVVRMNEGRWPKAALHGRVRGTRPRGRPRDTWLRRFRMSNNNRSVREMAESAANRQRWREYRHQMWDPTRRIPDGS